MLHHDDVVPLLVTEKAAAKLLGVSAAMLVAGRFRKRPLLPFVRVGSRSIRYRVADINDFIDRNTTRSVVNNGTNGATRWQAADRHGVSKSAVHRAVPHEENSREGQTADAEPPATDAENPQEDQAAETPRQTAEGKLAVADAENMQEAQPVEAPRQAAAGEPSASDADFLLEIPDFLRRSPK